ncbi:phage tail protein [uncultured Photobacterium sp.]|uniref:phage tail protein n=1 Tax=uncultured Photobacterium sp. TaxID=173973 RepID=UPI00262D211F|nr:phage tail protein [uncultured Photobacterium sp.]
MVSAFRYLAALVFRKPEMGNSSYPPPVAVEVARLKTGWDGNPIWYQEKAIIGEGRDIKDPAAFGAGGLNAAHIIHELIECPEWGTGNRNIDEAAFRQCADILYAEGFGLNAHWTKQQPVEQFIKDICRYINGYVFTDEATGKVTMRLARDNYSEADIPVLTGKQIKSARNVRRRSQADLINTLTVTYTDWNTYDKAAVTVMNSALLHATGRTIGETVNYPMLHDDKLAYRVAMRELRMLSGRLMTCELYCDTSAATLQPGDVVRVVYPPAGLNHIVRVQKKRRGSLAKPEVKLDVMEDIFSAVTGDYMPPPPSNWKDPINEPQPITDQAVMELPYWLLANTLNPSELAALKDYSCFVGWFAGKPTSDTLGADLYYSHFDRWLYSHRASFAPGSLLLAPISRTGTQLQLLGSDLTGQELPTLCLLGNELIVVMSLEGDNAQVKRGVLDTMPERHNAMTPVTILDGDALEAEFTAGERVSLRGLTVTPRGTLNEGEATVSEINLVGRAAKPLCVTNVQLNGSYWPESIALPLTVTLSHRNRISEVAEPQFLSDWFTNGMPEAGTETKVTLVDVDTGTVLYNETTTATELTFDSLTIKEGIKRLRLTLTATRSGNEAMQSYTHEFRLKNIAPNI